MEELRKTTRISVRMWKSRTRFEALRPETACVVVRFFFFPVYRLDFVLRISKSSFLSYDLSRSVCNIFFNVVFPFLRLLSFYTIIHHLLLILKLRSLNSFLALSLSLAFIHFFFFVFSFIRPLLLCLSLFLYFFVSFVCAFLSHKTSSFRIV